MVAKCAAALYFSLLLFLLPSTLPAPLEDDQLPQQQTTVFPSRVDHQGQHISYDLCSRTLTKRDVNGDTGPPQRLYFKVEAFGNSYILNVSNSRQFISSDHIVEFRDDSGGTEMEFQAPAYADCHHTGSLMGGPEEGEGGWVALSNCNGLHGVIATASGYLYIEPLRPTRASLDSEAQEHLVSRAPHNVNADSTCAYGQTSSAQEGRAPSLLAGEAAQRTRRALTTSTEHFVEVAVVADQTMLEYHGREEIQVYLLALMNAAAHLYQDPTIGHAMNLVLVRTIILESAQSGLSISSHALNSLASFCSWQSSLYTGVAHRPDVTVLITRTDICETLGRSCGTLGIAELSGACNPRKSCSISEDIGLGTAFTLAHEIGHNLGIRHDGDPSANCVPNTNFIMAPSFAQSHNPHHWSECSRQQLEEFLLSPASSCFSNQPLVQINSSSLGLPLPGMEVTPTEQCQLLHGPNATHCPNISNTCSYLWCRPDNDSECDHQHTPPAPGTECTLTSGKGGVCYQGQCVGYSSLSDPVDGGWGEWEPWGPCSLSCGTGVQQSVRLCDSPVPSNGGQYCLGLKRRYRTCNTQPCPDDISYRQTLCEREPPHHRYTSWEAPDLEYISWKGLKPCQHHCIAKPVNQLFTLMKDLPDGTPCLYASQFFPRNESLGVCVSGECVPVGCDKKLEEMSSRDECGVWCGNGSTCVPVSDTYTISVDEQHNGFFYQQAVTIPSGSGQVQISEIHKSDHFFIAAATATDTFNWNYRVERGDLNSYWFAGSKWWYERPSRGLEYFVTSGIIAEDVFLYVITNDTNRGVQYSAGVPLDRSSEFGGHYAWRRSEWGDCDVVCGEGVQRRVVECVRVEGEESVVVGEEMCAGVGRAAAVRGCVTEDCRYGWRVGEWGRCEGVCGEGRRGRVVECVLVNNDTIVDDSYCSPQATLVNTSLCHTQQGCHYEWRVGSWSECSAVCGEGERTRPISCVLTNNNTVADRSHCSEAPPETRSFCYTEQGCHYEWRVGGWSGCSVVCGNGERSRLISCVLTNNNTVADHSHCSEAPPETRSFCYTEQGCHYEWSVGSWSDCSADCGEGERSRQISCTLTNNNTLVDHNHCHGAPPKSRSFCYTEQGCSYEWSVGSWSGCSVICGNGERSRQISCTLTNNGTTVDDSHCSETPPESTAHCYEQQGCRYEWRVGSWSDCSAVCGEGERSRQISCLLVNNNTGVDNSHCLESPPESRSFCYTEQGCHYEWRVGSWSDCSTDCGEGERTRQISCTLTNNNTIVDHSHCSSEIVPESTSLCHTQQGCRYEWSAGSWSDCSAVCGEGERTRQIPCVLTNNNTRVDNRHCLEAFPETRSFCYTEQGCHYEWSVGSWSDCSTDCGEGERSRQITCTLTNNNTLVDHNHCHGAPPESRSFCYMEHGCHYEWRVGDWSDCSAVCGEGEKSRQISCVLTNNNTRVDKSHCLESPPETRSPCYTEQGCHYEWRVGSWSDCSAVCGEGERTRQISCVLTNNNTVADHSHCLEPLPERRSPCYTERGCHYEWSMGSWSDCSTDCGEGERTRQISCVLTNNNTRVDHSHCSSEIVPESTSLCHTQQGCRYEWRVGSWSDCSVICGNGERTRPISCVLTNNNTVADHSHCSEAPPETRAFCYTEQGCHFEWSVGSWSDCSVICGEGERTRQITCILTNNNTRVDNSHCLEPLPERRAPCYTEQGCHYEWSVGSWSDCSVVCGEGERTRQVSCILTNNDTVVQPAFCSADSMPDTTTSCGKECQFEWRVGEWGGCEGDSCEEGTKNREVWCVLLNNNSVVADGYCSPETRPSDSASCRPEECQYQWRVGVWGRCSLGCGEGVRVREVYCELVNGEGGPRRVQRDRCEGLPMPAEREVCMVEPCTNYQWIGGVWSECDAKCEKTGSQTRSVFCQHQNGTKVPPNPYCSWQSPPEVRRSCQGEPCPTTSPPTCVDNPIAACRLIVKFKLCFYYSHLCCRSCRRG